MQNARIREVRVILLVHDLLMVHSHRPSASLTRSFYVTVGKLCRNGFILLSPTVGAIDAFILVDSASKRIFKLHAESCCSGSTTTFGGSSNASQDHLDGRYKITNTFGYPLTLTYKVVQVLVPGYRISAPTPFLVQTELTLPDFNNSTSF